MAQRGARRMLTSSEARPPLGLADQPEALRAGRVPEPGRYAPGFGTLRRGRGPAGPKQVWACDPPPPSGLNRT